MNTLSSFLKLCFNNPNDFKHFFHLQQFLTFPQPDSGINPTALLLLKIINI